MTKTFIDAQIILDRMTIIMTKIHSTLMQHRRAATLATVLLIQAMIIVDVSIVNVALPAIQNDLGVGQAELAWILDGYLIVFGSFLLIAGRLGDLMGRKRVLLGGLGLFVGASALCGLAPNVELLVAARALQGLGGAFASAVVLAIIAIEYPAPIERARAMSLYVFISVGGGSLGLLAGGILTQAISWHWIFFVNVPLGILALAAGRTLIEDVPGLGVKDGVDWLGAVLVTVTAMVGVFTIIKAPERGWVSEPTLLTALATVALGALFVLRQRRAAHPILPPHVLRLRSLAGSSAVRGLFATGLFASFFVGTLYMQRVLGYGTLASGAAFLPQTLMVAALAIGYTTKLVTRFGAFAVLIAGLASMTAGLLVLSTIQAGGGYWPTMIVAFLMVGVGGGLSGAPLVTVAMSDVPAADTGIASAIVNLSMYIPGAIGLAVVGALTTDHTASLVAAGQSLPDALVGGYQLGLYVCAGCLAAAVLVALSVLRPARAAGEPAGAAAAVAIER
jgi:EmrB/QacA subfamily drug resistance transporter